MDILFLLQKDFPDTRHGTGLYYCPDCAFAEGILAYFPELREKLDIRYTDFPRPRKAITELVGEENQGCPNLILDPENHNHPLAEEFFRYEGRRHTTDTRLIAAYLSERYGIPAAHF